MVSHVLDFEMARTGKTKRGSSFQAESRSLVKKMNGLNNISRFRGVFFFSNFPRRYSNAK
jgi:hypothetical protein